MKKLLKLVLVIAVILVVLFYLGFGFRDLFGEWLLKAGFTDQQIGNVDQIYGDAMNKVQQGLNHLTKELKTVVDRLTDLIAGSEEAYQVVTRLYGTTRLPDHFEKLEEKALQGKRLCSVSGVLGNRTQPYQAGINPFEDGQSTWYAYGRFWEDNGIPLGVRGQPNAWPEELGVWLQKVYTQSNPNADLSRYTLKDGCMAAGVFLSSGEERIYPHSIAICDNGTPGGRAIYIEDVKYESGVPVLVWFSETDGDSTYTDEDGVLQAVTWEEFRAAQNVTHYIVPLNLFT